MGVCLNWVGAGAGRSNIWWNGKAAVERQFASVRLEQRLGIHGFALKEGSALAGVFRVALPSSLLPLPGGADAVVEFLLWLELFVAAPRKSLIFLI